MLFDVRKHLCQRRTFPVASGEPDARWQELDVEKTREMVLEFLRSREWSFEERETFLAVQVLGANAGWTILFFIPPSAEQLIIHSLLPVDLGEGNAANVLEYVTRANFGLAVGNFEIDLTDGPNRFEVRFRTSLDHSGFELHQEAIRNLVDANVQVADHYLPGLIDAARGEPAASCITAIERPTA